MINNIEYNIILHICFPNNLLKQLKQKEGVRKRLQIIFITFVGLVFITGCTSAPKITTTTPIQELGAPEWVLKGSGAFGGERGRVFYAVASASGIQNPSLLRMTADNRVRNEVAKVFQF